MLSQWIGTILNYCFVLSSYYLKQAITSGEHTKRGHVSGERERERESMLWMQPCLPKLNSHTQIATGKGQACATSPRPAVCAHTHTHTHTYRYNNAVPRNAAWQDRDKVNESNSDYLKPTVWCAGAHGAVTPLTLSAPVIVRKVFSCYLWYSAGTFSGYCYRTSFRVWVPDPFET